jgi:F-type H+-transporting ATPase subunit epsilon
VAEDDNTAVAADAFTCVILTPLRTVFEGEVRSVLVEGAGGSFEMFARHEPVMTPLKIGIVEIETDAGRRCFAVHGGFLEMDGATATILANSAENAEEIDMERARKAEARAKERLETISRHAEEGAKIDFDRAKLALLRSLQRMRAARKISGE